MDAETIWALAVRTRLSTSISASSPLRPPFSLPASLSTLAIPRRLSPLPSILHANLCVGLIEVGETVLDPFGTDPEDFALLHFVEVTICHSHETIEIEPCGVRAKERETYYDPKELHAVRATDSLAS